MLKVGIEGRREMIVTRDKSAKFMESGGLEIFATPMMIALMEAVAFDSVIDYLEEGQGTVGTKVDIEHISPTPVGMKVTGVSKLVEIDRRRLVFDVEAYDEEGLIGKGTHERFIIDSDKFQKKANAKLTANRSAAENITIEGNPAKPEGESGAKMLNIMNDSHFAVTGWMLDIVGASDGDRILDIGCGGGMTLKRLSSQVLNGSLVGLDYSPLAIEESAKLNGEDVSTGKLKLVEASVCDMPLTSNNYDKAVSVESFYFWGDHETALKEINRVLKPGGSAFICIDIYENGALDDKVRENITRYNMFVPTIDEFKDLFDKAGFEKVIVHTSDNGKPWICVEGIK